MDYQGQDWMKLMENYRNKKQKFNKLKLQQKKIKKWNQNLMIKFKEIYYR